MLKLTSIVDLRKHLAEPRRSGRQVGFVPTMGALHEGHLSLMRAARADCDVVVVSIFVNPTQFGPGEDYEKYPRTEQADLSACDKAGVDIVFYPPVEEIYPAGAITTVSVSSDLTGVLCGPCRPGHFDGVTTVVAKLFNIVQPDRAYFGQKDAQQAVVIKQMTRDLLLPIEIVVCPTVREPDGLAMSSRNAYLTDAERQQALSLSQSLNRTREQITAGVRETARLTAAIRQQIESAGPCEIEYAELVDADTLKPKPTAAGRCLIALAVRIGSTRLIDNIIVDVPQ